MRTLLGLTLLTMSISACATAGSEPVCPQLIEYTKAEQIRAADELKTLPESSIVRSKFMPDYGRMRGEARACRGEWFPSIVMISGGCNNDRQWTRQRYRLGCLGDVGRRTSLTLRLEWEGYVA